MTKKSKPKFRKLNVGCGEFRAEGYVNIDTNDTGGPQPDIKASVLDLPFTAGSFDKVYAGHVLEHLELADIPKALDEVKRVLASDGTFVVVGPDLDRAYKDFPGMVDSILHGDHRWEGDEHTWESTETATVKLLEDSGWITRTVPIESSELNEWPVTSRIGWQFAIFATKA